MLFALGFVFMFTIGGLSNNHLVPPFKTTVCGELLTIMLLEFYWISVTMYNFEQSAGNQPIVSKTLDSSETKRSQAQPKLVWAGDIVHVKKCSLILNYRKVLVRSYSSFSPKPHNEDKILNLNTEKVYKSLKEDRVKIIKQEIGNSGVYCLVNQINGHTYVGSSMNLAHRARNYLNNAFLKSKQNANMPITKALLKYDQLNFTLLILEYVEPEFLTTRETFYITNILPYYNVLKQGYSSLGYKHTEETKKLLSELATNRTHSDKTKGLIAKAVTGENNPFYNKSHSLETKIRIMEAKSAYPVYVYNSFKELLVIFPSVRCLANLIKSNHTTIVNNIKQQTIFRGEWYLENLPYNISDTPLISFWESKECELLVEQIKSSPVEKAVFVYDLDRKFLDKYDGVTATQRGLGVNHLIIRNCAKVGGIYNGYIFSYERLEWAMNKISNKVTLRDRNFRSFSTTAKQNIINKATTLQSSPVNLNPWFLTGFTDAEGSFILSIYKDDTKTTGWRVQAIFQIELHEKDLALLELTQKFFGVGKIYSPRKDLKQYKVRSTKDLQVIINHFDRYPLISKKRADYELFKGAISLMDNKEHLTLGGLDKLISIRAALNLGLTSVLNTAFPNVITFPKLDLWDSKIKDLNWLAGFTSGCLQLAGKWGVFLCSYY